MERKTNKIKLWTFDNFVTPEECQQLLDLAESKGYVSSEVQSLKDTTAEPATGQGSMKVQARNSTTSFVGDSPICDVFINKAKNALKKLKIPVDFCEVEGLQVQKYLPGQKYNPHYDTFEDKESTKQRWWTVMVYLGPSTGLEGGSTTFPNINESVQPKQGRAVIWNNLKDNHCRDTNTLHMGSEVTKGTKYVVTIWFRKPPGKDYLCSDKESFHNKDFYKETTDYYTYIPYAIFFFLLLLILLFMLK